MQRLLNNLTAVAVIGLISMSGSLALAHGGGGGHGGSHGSSHSSFRSGGGSSHASHNHASHSHANKTSKSKTHNNKSHNKSASNKKPILKQPNKPHHNRHRYHMHYPVRGWFDGDIDDGDADAAEGGIDVEFSSIRQLDAGDPSKKLAPAYRVWFHNNSTVDIDQPFDVAILASTDGQLAEKLPYASVRVDGMAADETTSVDIRLPIEALSMGSDGDAAAYSYLHTIIDSQRELVETNKANNLSVYGRQDIPALEE
jgi:hypothetical protein